MYINTMCTVFRQSHSRMLRRHHELQQGIQGQVPLSQKIQHRAPLPIGSLKALKLIHAMKQISQNHSLKMACRSMPTPMVSLLAVMVQSTVRRSLWIINSNSIQCKIKWICCSHQQEEFYSGNSHKRMIMKFFSG